MACCGFHDNPVRYFGSLLTSLINLPRNYHIIWLRRSCRLCITRRGTLKWLTTLTKTISTSLWELQMKYAQLHYHSCYHAVDEAT